MARRSFVAQEADTAFPAALRRWVDTDGALLRSLLALRRLGSEGSEALSAALAVKRVAVLRASWELWEALVEGSGGDAEGLLLRALPLEEVELARLAIWGPSWRVPVIRLLPDPPD